MTDTPTHQRPLRLCRDLADRPSLRNRARDLAQLTIYPNDGRKTRYDVVLRSDGMARLTYHSRIPGTRTGMRYVTSIPVQVIAALNNYLGPKLNADVPDVETAVSTWLSNIPEPILINPKAQPIVPGTWRQARLGSMVVPKCSGAES